MPSLIDNHTKLAMRCVELLLQLLQGAVDTINPCNYRFLPCR